MLHLPYRLVFFSILLPLSLLLGANQCGREEVDIIDLPQPETGTLQVRFRHHFGPDSLELNNKYYIIPSGDTIKFRYLAYFISNIKLINSQTGIVFSEPESYHFISKYHNHTGFTINSIPLGNYDRVEFSVGVEEPANMSGERTGDLGTFLAMWNSYTGYDFFTFDAMRLKYSGITDYDLLFKVQGASNYKTLTFNLPQTLEYQQPENYKMDVGVELKELFQNPHLLSFTSSNIVEGKVNPKKLAENYANGMFRISNITR